MFKEDLQYEVWLLGFDKEGKASDYDCFLVDFEDLDDATAYAQELFDVGTAKGGKKKLRETFKIPPAVTSIEIRVEAVIPDEDDEDSFTNQDTSYSEIIDLT